MPDRTYVPRVPPTRVDRLFAHPFEIALSVVLLLVGIRTLLDAAALPASVEALPGALSYVFSIVSIAAGALTLAGLATSRVWAYGLEQGGLWLSAAAWACYASGLIGMASTARVTLMISALLALSAGSAIRAIALHRISSARLSGLRLASEEEGGRNVG